MLSCLTGPRQGQNQEARKITKSSPAVANKKDPSAATKCMTKYRLLSECRLLLFSSCSSPASYCTSSYCSFSPFSSSLSCSSSSPSSSSSTVFLALPDPSHPSRALPTPPHTELGLPSRELATSTPRKPRRAKQKAHAQSETKRSEPLESPRNKKLNKKQASPDKKLNKK